MVGLRLVEKWRELEGARFTYKLNRIFWELKYAWQRAFRGYDDIEVFNLDYSFAKKYSAILKDFRENLHGHPGSMTFEEWKAEILEMEMMLNQIALSEEGRFNVDIDKWPMYDEYLNNLKNKFFESFSKHYFNMWD